MSRYRSRKFLTLLLAQVVALVVLFVPEHEDQITQTANTIGGLLLSLGTALGYIYSEAKVDAASLTGSKATERKRVV